MWCTLAVGQGSAQLRRTEGRTVPKPPAPSFQSRPSGRLAILSWSAWMRHSKVCGSWKGSLRCLPGLSVLHTKGGPEDMLHLSAQGKVRLHGLTVCMHTPGGRHSRLCIKGTLAGRFQQGRAQGAEGCRVSRAGRTSPGVEAMLRVGVECACESGLLISTVVPRRRPGPALSISSESILCPFCVPCALRLLVGGGSGRAHASARPDGLQATGDARACAGMAPRSGTQPAGQAELRHRWQAWLGDAGLPRHALASPTGVQGWQAARTRAPCWPACPCGSCWAPRWRR